MKKRFEMFTALISKINRNIRKIENQEMSEYGLRSTHVSCIYHIYSAEKLTATGLCECCEEDKATISRALDFLEKKGFVVCESKLAKRYNSHFYLTEKGKEVGKKITDKINCVFDEICIDLTEEGRVEFYRSLSVISDNLELCVKGINKAKKIKKQA